MIDWGVRGLRDLGFGEGLGERGIEGLRGRLGYFGRKEMEGMDPKLDPRHKDTDLKMDPSGHCRVLFHGAISDF